LATLARPPSVEADAAATPPAPPPTRTKPAVQRVEAEVEPEPEPEAVSEPARKPALVASTKPAPPPAGPSLAERISGIREALDGEDFVGARNRLERARTETRGNDEAQRNLGLWEGIIAYEEGLFDDAAAAFERLDPQASYAASGWGQGAVPNWIARTRFAQGDVRGAVAVLDQVGRADPDQYAAARLWEGVALSTLGMTDLAQRTWSRLAMDVGGSVSGEGRASVKTAEFLSGTISEKDYRGAVAPVPAFENDMHWFLAWTQSSTSPDLARAHWMKSMETSQGREFPYHLSQAEIAGEGIAGR
jgi:tetratricopeptide (TPR) repeat protein